MTQTVEKPVQYDRDGALQYYRDQLDAGQDPTAAELAATFGRTDRWARGIRSAVQAERATVPAAPAEHQAPASTPDPAPSTNPAEQAERPAFIEPVPAATAPETSELVTELDGRAENLAGFAQNRAQDGTAGNLRPSGHSDQSSRTEPHSAAPSALAPAPAAEPVPVLAPEQAPAAGTAIVPPTSPAAVPAPAAEHPALTPAPTGTTEQAVTPAPEPRKASGRFVAWIAFATGVLASVAANVLHAADGGAAVAELVGAAFWPVALLLAVELLTRVDWPRGFWWGFGRFAGVGLVGIVAAVLSYRHMAGLLQMWGEDSLNAHLGPLAVDGLMLVAATSLLAISRNTK